MTLTRSEEDRFQMMFDAYAERLPAKLQLIDDLWVRVAAEDEGDALQSLHLALHSLAGSAETFGYAQLGKSAKEIELVLAALLDAQGRPSGILERLAPLYSRLRHAAKVAQTRAAPARA